MLFNIIAQSPLTFLRERAEIPSSVGAVFQIVGAEPGKIFLCWPEYEQLSENSQVQSVQNRQDSFWVEIRAM